MVLHSLPSYFRYWGKASRGARGSSGAWHPVVYHSLDVAAVIHELSSRGDETQLRWATILNVDSDGLCAIAVLSAYLHDIGKFSKSFQSLAPDIYEQRFPDNALRSYSVRHDSLGFALWRGDPTDSRFRLKEIVAASNPGLAATFETVNRAAFGHHGMPPCESTHGGSAPLLPGEFFDEADISAVEQFVETAMQLIPMPALDTPSRALRHRFTEYSWFLAGRVVIADWIASNTEYFPFVEGDVDLSTYWAEHAIPQASTALDGLYRPALDVRRYRPGAELDDVYPFLAGPSPLQQAARSVQVSSGPGIYILEDVTGAGKTEAALILASRIMAAGGGSGVYIALPTTATANAMYDRMRIAYAALYEAGERPSLILAHGSAHLSEKFSASVGFEPSERELDYDGATSASAQCNEWYADNRKKALLADVGVGTIDQALLAILPARHQSLRLVGLQDKVLIVDEVHAYDRYINHLLSVLLRAHAMTGGSSILLSATIPNEQRKELIEGYGALDEGSADMIRREDRFPLLTGRSRGELVTHAVGTRVHLKRSVRVEFVHHLDDVLREIETKATDGQAVCWIRNTVSDARNAYGALLDRAVVSSDRIQLFHSRFAMVDRLRIERDVIDGFGKESIPEVRSGRVLIATQVVEQSLDLDFDTLISDIAPIDLLIQRAGRLHRHTRTAEGMPTSAEDERDGRAAPVLWVHGPEYKEEPEADWGSGELAGTFAVYSDPSVLWRTARMLHTRRGWIMPEDARSLIEGVYGEKARDMIPEGLAQATLAAQGQAHAGSAMGRLNALKLERRYNRSAAGSGEWSEDEVVTTRLTQDTVEVALCVERDGALLPYAAVDRSAWDMSCLRVPVREWKQADISLISSAADAVRQRFKRLRYVQLYALQLQSDTTPQTGEVGAARYNARLGWGATDQETK